MYFSEIRNSVAAVIFQVKIKRSQFHFQFRFKQTNCMFQQVANQCNVRSFEVNVSGCRLLTTVLPRRYMTSLAKQRTKHEFRHKTKKLLKYIYWYCIWRYRKLLNFATLQRARLNYPRFTCQAYNRAQLSTGCKNYRILRGSFCFILLACLLAFTLILYMSKHVCQT